MAQNVVFETNTFYCTHPLAGELQTFWIHSANWQAALISRDESLRLFSLACFPKENIPRRYQSSTELSFVFATTTQKSINKYPSKGLVAEVGSDPTKLPL